MNILKFEDGPADSWLTGTAPRSDLQPSDTTHLPFLLDSGSSSSSVNDVLRPESTPGHTVAQPSRLPRPAPPPGASPPEAGRTRPVRSAPTARPRPEQPRYFSATASSTARHRASVEGAALRQNNSPGATPSPSCIPKPWSLATGSSAHSATLPLRALRAPGQRARQRVGDASSVRSSNSEAGARTSSQLASTRRKPVFAARPAGDAEDVTADSVANSSGSRAAHRASGNPHRPERLVERVSDADDFNLHVPSSLALHSGWWADDGSGGGGAHERRLHTLGRSSLKKIAHQHAVDDPQAGVTKGMGSPALLSGPVSPRRRKRGAPRHATQSRDAVHQASEWTHPWMTSLSAQPQLPTGARDVAAPPANVGSSVIKSVLRTDINAREARSRQAATDHERPGLDEARANARGAQSLGLDAPEATQLQTTKTLDVRRDDLGCSLHRDVVNEAKSSWATGLPSARSAGEPTSATRGVEAADAPSAAHALGQVGRQRACLRPVNVNPSASTPRDSTSDAASRSTPGASPPQRDRTSQIPRSPNVQRGESTPGGQSAAPPGTVGTVGGVLARRRPPELAQPDALGDAAPADPRRRRQGVDEPRALDAALIGPPSPIVLASGIEPEAQLDMLADQLQAIKHELANGGVEGGPRTLEARFGFDALRTDLKLLKAANDVEMSTSESSRIGAARRVSGTAVSGPASVRTRWRHSRESDALDKDVYDSPIHVSDLDAMLSTVQSPPHLDVEAWARGAQGGAAPPETDHPSAGADAKPVLATQESSQGVALSPRDASRQSRAPSVRVHSRFSEQSDKQEKSAHADDDGATNLVFEVEKQVRQWEREEELAPAQLHELGCRSASAGVERRPAVELDAPANERRLREPAPTAKQDGTVAPLAHQPGCCRCM